jgi:ribonuclease HI
VLPRAGVAEWPKNYMKLTIYTDGGARGNPGPAAIGVVIKNQKNQNLAAYGEFIGRATNNVAEYMALISGLKKAHNLGATEVECILDSLLVAEQMNGRFKIKDKNLQKLFVEAWNATQNFKHATFRHTCRENNKEADKMLNKVLDKHFKK